MPGVFNCMKERKLSARMLRLSAVWLFSVFYQKLGGVSPKPYRAVDAERIILGEKITEALAEEAARLSVIEARPLSKNGYKVRIVETLVKRALLDQE